MVKSNYIAIFVVCFLYPRCDLGNLRVCDWELSTQYATFRDTDGDELIGRAALVDTMKDLILDFIGAAVITVVGYISIRKQSRCRLDY